MRPETNPKWIVDEVALRASDGVRLAASLWRLKKPRRNLILMVPGFSQNKDTPIMRRASEILADYGDLLCLNVRGTGKSEGRYHFGAQEHLDAEAALRWAKGRYREVELLGFSLGAYIALRGANLHPRLVKRLYFVSGPSSVKDIITSLGPLRQLSVIFRPEVNRVRFWAGQDYFFRWGSIRGTKPQGEELAAGLKVPISVLVGGRDQLVLPRLSRRVYDAAASKKLWTVFEKGYHAEYLSVMQERNFRNWFLRSRKALSARGKARA